jgi:hypothetical protein
MPSGPFMPKVVETFQLLGSLAWDRDVNDPSPFPSVLRLEDHGGGHHTFDLSRCTTWNPKVLEVIQVQDPNTLIHRYPRNISCIKVCLPPNRWNQLSHVHAWDTILDFFPGDPHSLSSYSLSPPSQPRVIFDLRANTVVDRGNLERAWAAVRRAWTPLIPLPASLEFWTAEPKEKIATEKMFVKLGWELLEGTVVVKAPDA